MYPFENKKLFSSQVNCQATSGNLKYFIMLRTEDLVIQSRRLKWEKFNRKWNCSVHPCHETRLWVKKQQLARKDHFLDGRCFVNQRNVLPLVCLKNFSKTSFEKYSFGKKTEALELGK
jgi:hypothetical protein